MSSAGSDSQRELVSTDSVLSENDVTVLRTSKESGMEESTVQEQLDSIQRLSISLDSELPSFASESENGYFPSMSSDSGSDTSEVSQALFEAELIKFLESFGVNESSPASGDDTFDNLLISDDSTVDKLLNPDDGPVQQNTKDDVDDFLKSMQMMKSHPTESDTGKQEESSGWFGSFSGIVKGVVNESVHGWQSLGKGVKKMLNAEENTEVKCGDLIDLSTETDDVMQNNTYQHDELFGGFKTETAEGKKHQAEGDITCKTSEHLDSQNAIYVDLKTFGGVVKGFFNKGFTSVHSVGEVMSDMNPEATPLDENTNSNSEHNISLFTEAVVNNETNSYLHSSAIPKCNNPSEQESLIDSVMSDMADPLTSIRYLYVTGDDVELQKSHCEQEVTDVVEYVARASHSAKEVLLAYQTWLPIRQDTIKKLTHIAKNMEESGRDAKFLDTIGISSGLAGSAVALTGLLLAPVTGGIASGLIIKGGLMAGVGGVTSAGAAIGGSISMKEKLKEVENCISEDKEKTEVLFEKLRNHASVINRAQQTIENLRQGILLLLAQGAKFGAKSRKLLCIGMNVIKHNKKSVGYVLKRLGLPGIKAVNKKVAAFNFAKAGAAPTMIGVKAVRAMRVGHSLVPYLFMATAVWESMELYSTVSSLMSGESVPEAREVKLLIDNLESEIQDITNEVKELGILLDSSPEDGPNIMLQTTPPEGERVDTEKITEINNNTSEEDSGLSLELTINSVLMSD